MLSTFLLSALLSTPAAAKDRPTIAVVGLHDENLDAADQRAAVESLRDALGSGKRFETWGPDEVARAIAGREALILAETYLAPARRVLEDGRLLHDQAQPEQAVPALEQAVEGLIEIMPSTDASKELWEAYLYLGASHLEIGEEQKAAEAFAAAVAVNPERLPDAARIPPNIVQAYERAKRNAMAKSGSLTVKVTGQADVFINGQGVGSAPAKIAEWPAGEVYVRARGPNGEMAYTKVVIVQGANASVDLELGPAVLPSPGESAFARTRTNTSLYKALGEQAEADLVLVAGIASGQAWVQLFSPPADAFSNALKVDVDGDSVEEIVEALPGLLDVVNDEGALPSVATTATAGPMDPSDNRLLAAMLLDPKPLTPLPPSRSRASTFLVAGGVGALVVGGVVGGILLANGGDGNRGTIIVGPVPE